MWLALAVCTILMPMTAGLHTLYSAPPAAARLGVCAGFDRLLSDEGATTWTLLKLIVEGGASVGGVSMFQCLEASGHPTVGPMLLFAYLLLAVVLLRESPRRNAGPRCLHRLASRSPLPHRRSQPAGRALDQDF